MYNTKVASHSFPQALLAGVASVAGRLSLNHRQVVSFVGSLLGSATSIRIGPLQQIYHRCRVATVGTVAAGESDKAAFAIDATNAPSDSGSGGCGGGCCGGCCGGDFVHLRGRRHLADGGDPVVVARGPRPLAGGLGGRRFRDARVRARSRLSWEHIAGGWGVTKGRGAR